MTYFSGPYPNFGEIFLDLFFKHPIALILFYPLAISALANCSNLTDGVNVLCGMIFLSILVSLIFLGYQQGDNIIMMVILIVMMLIGVFLCFNYPKGNIFLVNIGAYVLAFLTGMITIMFFGRHIDMSPWFVVLVLLYPMTEVIFSVTRRLYQNQL